MGASHFLRGGKVLMKHVKARPHPGPLLEGEGERWSGFWNLVISGSPEWVSAK